MGTLGGRHTGIGMTSDRTRARMVDRLRSDGIKDEVVLAAINAVPRHIFVDEALAIRAYENSALPIGHGQTISQPWVVARMTELARHGRTLNSVLEIGTGCGYQTAVLAGLATQVYTVERIAALLAKARRNLSALKIRNVALKHGDGSNDLGEELAVDAIVVTAGATHVPSALLRYLNPGGRMVIPLAHTDEREPMTQHLTVIEAGPNGFREETLDAVRFVPLLSGLA
jgi:protein-L-isoaspartate(D-aspartate) O-methyltransferase